MTKGALSIWRQLALGVFLILTVLTFSIIAVADLAAQPQRQAREKAERIARDYTDLEEIDSFAIFNKEKTYYSLQGRRRDGQEIALLIPESGGDIGLYRLKDGVTAEQAAKTALKKGAGVSKRAILGIRKKRPVWEIYDGKNYYYIDFESGDLISKEGL